MKRINRRALFLVAGLAILTAGVAFPGVAFPDTAKAQTIVVGAGSYQPMYYNGYLVFFDDWGRPFINVDGEIVFIPTTYAYYATYVRHFRLNRARYCTWYRTHGVRLRRHRSSMNHRSRVRTHTPSHRRIVVTPRAPQNRRSWVRSRAPVNRHTVTRRAPARRHTVTRRAPARRHTVTRRAPARRHTVTRRAPARSSHGRTARSSSSRRRR